MALINAIKQLYRPLRTAILKNNAVRSRLAFDLNRYYYADLNIAVPLGHGLTCPVLFQDAWYSFTEIFLEREYDVFDNIPLPDRWLDLGCHAGYFSLWLAWQRAQSGKGELPAALLIDADDRMNSAVKQMLEVNRLNECLYFMPGAIGDSSGTIEFNRYSVMASAKANSKLLRTEKASSVSVPVITQEQIAEKLAPPYDLIKVDIEGSEYELLEHYSSIIRASKHLLLEWHSWHSGGGSKKQIIQMCNDLNFDLTADLKEHDFNIEGNIAQCGNMLFSNRNSSS